MLNIKDYLIDSDGDSEDGVSVSPPPKEPGNDAFLMATPLPLPFIPDLTVEKKPAQIPRPVTPSAPSLSHRSSMVYGTDAIPFEPKKPATPLNRFALATPSIKHGSENASFHSQLTISPIERKKTDTSGGPSAILSAMASSHKEPPSSHQVANIIGIPPVSSDASPPFQSFRASTPLEVSQKKEETVLLDSKPVAFDAPYVHEETEREDSPILHFLPRNEEEEKTEDAVMEKSKEEQEVQEGEEDLAPFLREKDADASAVESKEEPFVMGHTDFPSPDSDPSSGAGEIKKRRKRKTGGNESEGLVNPPKKKIDHKALIERLSKPLAINQKYEEKVKLEKARQAAEEAEQERKKMEELAPIPVVQWKINAKRFQLRDLEQHNACYRNV